MLQDKEMFMLGDYLGNLYLLTLKPNLPSPPDLLLEHLGRISVPKALAYLDNAFVFVASEYNDSQLIQLLNESDDKGNKIIIHERITNIGPITDFTLRGLESHQVTLLKKWL